MIEWLDIILIQPDLIRVKPGPAISMEEVNQVTGTKAVIVGAAIALAGVLIGLNMKTIETEVAKAAKK